MFCKEVVTWKSLRHPNVLPLLGVTMGDGHFAMISEWMANGDINGYVKAHRDANRFELVGIYSYFLLRQSQMKLLFAAQRRFPGIDIYPWRGDDTRGSERGMVSNASAGQHNNAFFIKANILIDQDGHARLADFGLLTIVSDSTYPTTSSSSKSSGTVRWMSPERLDPDRVENAKGPTKESDCYALGMVILEVLTGQPPFPRYTSLIVMKKIVDGERPERPQGPKAMWFTDDLWGMLEQCWSFQPEVRPTVQAVLECLERSSAVWHPLPPDSDDDDGDETDSDDDFHSTVSHCTFPRFIPNLTRPKTSPIVGEATSQYSRLSPALSHGPPRSMVDPVMTRDGKVESTAPIIIPSPRVYPSAPLQQTGRRRDNSSEGADISTTSDSLSLLRPTPPVGISPKIPKIASNWRTRLNNFLMHNGGTERLKYMYKPIGPAHQPTWHCTAYSKSDVPLCDVCLELSLVDGIPYPDGQNRVKRLACENAAGNCYMALSL